jgi:alanyl-tRNA synthetase
MNEELLKKSCYMKSYEIRKTFFNFFEKKSHKIVASAPMVVKDDPTLMFTNAGMNQFKDVFLGNNPAPAPRVADTQKCLRVSGKHNDLEEVGHDTYHHTMFEMLGNWSFGDYFKEEAIAWAWELLTKEYGISEDLLYVTIFGGDKTDNIPSDQEAYDHWKKIIPEERILMGSKKDNFWEMGDTGPCGPCSEIHIDLRSNEDKKAVAGKDLVNQDHPEVVEVWNLVFIEFNRMTDGSLKNLPQKHIDTGMGFERLCMALQDKKSNYDTDVFQPLIAQLEHISKKSYGTSEELAIAMRVISDHIRAVSFAIADGQLPSNIKAGYVIRRILRRAIRYGFTFLDLKTPFMHLLLPVLVEQMGDPFAELRKQKELISKVIYEEEQAFLKTLETGIQMLEKVMKESRTKKERQVSGKVAFELYDTYGFPLDLTALILKENNLEVDRAEFQQEMEKQKARSRQAAATKTGDWIFLSDTESSTFTGYDELQTPLRITRYRPLEMKGKTYYQVVFDKTPFYAEAGGQVGDTGYIEDDNGNKTTVRDTKKENNLTVHIIDNLPEKPEATFKAVVSSRIRTLTANNHTATHLLHHALREVLGSHVEQKGSLVRHDHLRFDFSHYSRMSEEEVRKVEKHVNRMIRNNTGRKERREVPLEKAKEMGAISLFGEKYDDSVRVIQFGDSIELCGGTHVEATGQIGLFKIRSEGAIAAGIRRIEAVTADEAENYIEDKLGQLKEITALYKNTKDIVRSVKQSLEENKKLQREIEQLTKARAMTLKEDLKKNIIRVNGVNFLAKKVNVDMAVVKDLAFALLKEVDDLYLVLAVAGGQKANLTVALSDSLIKEKKMHAGNIIKVLSKEIDGGGGGQPHFASAGGKKPDGIQAALDKARKLISE